MLLQHLQRLWENTCNHISFFSPQSQLRLEAYFEQDIFPFVFSDSCHRLDFQSMEFLRYGHQNWR
mgnify:CR=1 FL=1